MLNSLLLDTIPVEIKKEIIFFNIFEHITSLANLRIVNKDWKRLVDECARTITAQYFPYFKFTVFPKRRKNNPLKILKEEYDLYKAEFDAKTSFGLILCALLGNLQKIINAELPEDQKQKLYAISFAQGHGFLEHLSDTDKDVIKNTAINEHFVSVAGNIAILKSLVDQNYIVPDSDRFYAIQRQLFNYWHDHSQTYMYYVLSIYFGTLPENEKNDIRYSESRAFHKRYTTASLYYSAFIGDQSMVKNLLNELNEISKLTSKTIFLNITNGKEITEDALKIAKEKGFDNIVALINQFRRPALIFEQCKSIGLKLTSLLLFVMSSFQTGFLFILGNIVATLGVRQIFKQNAFHEYENKSTEEIDALPPTLHQAFDQGVKSSLSYWEWCKSNNPIICPAACYIGKHIMLAYMQ